MKLRLILFALLSLGSSALAATVFDTGGFESPLNTAGNLTGQPATLGGGGTSNWVQTPGTSTAVVQSGVVQAGSQAVLLTRGSNSDQRFAVAGLSPVTASFTTVFAEWDMYVPTPTAALPQGSFGPMFGFEAYDDSTGPALLVGSLFVDQGTRDILYQAAGTGFLTPTGSFVSYDTWNEFELKFDYATDTYTFYLNDNLLGSSGFVDGGDQFTDGNISGLAAAGDPGSLALTGEAYFDNLIVTVVPEPSAMVHFLVGCCGMFFRRNR
ncbi:MAG: hypothetical protein R3F19_01435 [Verrucomicrobiales bacterium]